MNRTYRVFMYLIGLCSGAILGLSLSLISMVLLTMISTDKILNAYFGICFMALGGMMLAKLYRKNKIVNIDVGTG